MTNFLVPYLVLCAFFAVAAELAMEVWGFGLSRLSRCPASVTLSLVSSWSPSAPSSAGMSLHFSDKAMER